MRLRRVLAGTVIVLIGLAGALVIAVNVSPWPGVLVIRAIFDKGAADASAALVKHLPPQVIARSDLRYDPNDPDAKLDLYLPQAAQAGSAKPITVVWVHGGAWVSGRKEDIGHYARILAGRGFTVASVDYTLAPQAIHPVPVRQVNVALAWLRENSAALQIDAERIVLAGDSAGAHIVTQLAVALTEPAYAATLGIRPGLPAANIRGMLLFCGAYDTEAINLDGPFGIFLRTVLRAYSGTRDFRNDESFRPSSVVRHVTGKFPPAFITAGNGDPLLAQSRVLADRLSALGVRTDTLFFPADRVPPLAHEYQFNLDDPAGKTALDRVVNFLHSLGSPGNTPTTPIAS